MRWIYRKVAEIHPEAELSPLEGPISTLQNNWDSGRYLATTRFDRLHVDEEIDAAIELSTLSAVDSLIRTVRNLIVPYLSVTESSRTLLAFHATHDSEPMRDIFLFENEERDNFVGI